MAAALTVGETSDAGMALRTERTGQEAPSTRLGLCDKDQGWAYALHSFSKLPPRRARGEGGVGEVRRLGEEAGGRQSEGAKTKRTRELSQNQLVRISEPVGSGAAPGAWRHDGAEGHSRTTMTEHLAWRMTLAALGPSR
jgi:hypothetical protein